MALKSTKKTFKTNLKDISEVLEDFRNHFENKGFKVNIEDTADGAFISLTNDSIFKTISGLKTGLNITLISYDDSIEAKMDVGIFGKQAIPGIIAMLVFWPILVTQIIGLINQSKLDDEAYRTIEESIRAHEPKEEKHEAFCPFCGGGVKKDARFCPHCGKEILIEKKCPKCGEVVEESTKFCPKCGHQFE